PPSIALPEGVVLDEHIHGIAEDRLDRSNYARVVSDEIAAIPAGSSTVLAVTGSWGTGKTSFMNLVFEQLKQDRERVVTNFNPWLFSGTEDLIARFFQDVASKLKLALPVDRT